MADDNLGKDPKDPKDPIDPENPNLTTNALLNGTNLSDSFEAKADEELEKYNNFRSETLKAMSNTTIEDVGTLSKSLSDVTADTQVQTAALGFLGSLPFDELIGGPLKAAISAQSEAAKTTLKFIESVGLKKDKVVMVSFEYVSGGTLKKFQIPLLTLVPIPSFAIKALDYEFKVKVTADSSANASTSNSLSNTWNAGYNSLPSASTPATEAKPEEKKKEEKPEENKSEGTPKKTASEAGSNAADKAKALADAEAKKKAEAEAKKKAEAAAEAAKIAEAAASAKQSPSGMSMSATISTKKDSSASRESKYSVEATMDVRINAGQEDLPTGVLTILQILNSAHNDFDPDGELIVTPETVTIGSNGKAIVMAKYTNEEGLYAPASINCDGASVDVVSKSTAKITFTKEGVYPIVAGSQTSAVTVNPAPTTKVLIKEEDDEKK